MEVTVSNCYLKFSSVTCVQFLLLMFLTVANYSIGEMFPQRFKYSAYHTEFFVLHVFPEFTDTFHVSNLRKWIWIIASLRNTVNIFVLKFKWVFLHALD